MVENSQQSILLLSGHEYEVVGVHSAGLLNDLRYRPNKYFHPIEEVRYDQQQLTILYAGEVRPLEESTRLSLAQVQELVFGVIDARQQLAHRQTFYIADHPQAFSLDSKGRVRIGLLNLHRVDKSENSDETRSVDALLDLIAAHSPEAQKRIHSYRHKVHTLRQLKQVLERGSNHQWLLGAAVVLAVLAGSLFLLGNYGPPRVRKSLQGSWQQLRSFSIRAVRSGSDEWYAQLRKERRQRDKHYAPVTVNLVIQPVVRSPRERQQLYLALHKLLAREFPLLKYQLHVPYLNFSKTAANLKRSLCGHAFPKHACKAESWLLVLPGYKGSSRPLVEAIREVLQRKVRGKALSIRYQSVAGLLTLSLQPLKKKKPVNRPQPRKSGPTARPNPTRP
jgi:hypothetical protein